MEQKEVESGLYHMPLRLLPVFFSRNTEKVYWNWVLPREKNAPKPRNLLRDKEVPPEDLSLDNSGRDIMDGRCGALQDCSGD